MNRSPLSCPNMGVVEVVTLTAVPVEQENSHGARGLNLTGLSCSVKTKANEESEQHTKQNLRRPGL